MIRSLNRNLICLAVTFSAVVASAGDFKGNGGGAIQCPGQELEILDFHEARALNLGQVQLGLGRTEADQSQVYLSRLSVHSPLLAAQFARQYLSFESESVFLDSVPIEDIDDLGVQIPAHCQWRQIVNQNPLLLPPGKKYLVDRNAWAGLEPLQKVGLIFHELLYRQSKSETSKGLRLINGLIGLDVLNAKPLSQRLKLWTDAGLSWMEAQGLSFVIDQQVQIQDDILLSAKPVTGSAYHWQGYDFVLNDWIFTFHANGNPKAFCFSNKPKIQFFGQETTLECWGNPSLMVQFRENGQMKFAKVSVLFSGINGPNFKLWFGEVNFYPDGAIESLVDASGDVEIQGRRYKVSSRQKVLFHPNGAIKTIAWGWDEGSLNPVPFPLHVWGQVIYPKGQYPVNFDANGQLLNFVAGNDGRIQTPQGQWITYRKDMVVNVGGQ